MDIQYVYTKKRNQLGRPTNFTDRSAETLAEIIPNLNLLQEFIYRDPVEIGTQNTIQLSEHEVNSIRCSTESKGINHTEGGWPKDVNIQEQDQINRFRKKIEKDEFYLNSLYRLIRDLEMDIKQNNAIDIHQTYFQNKFDDYDEPFTVKTTNLYSYNSNINQMANHISWQPDGQRKIAVSYCNFDYSPVIMSKIDSLVWDIQSPNKPELILKPNSSLSSVEFNQKDTHQILAGCLNGQVCIFDLRKGNTPAEQSSIEFSHRETVRNALWLQSKTGTEFFSAAADGNIYWWDTKKMNKPVDKLVFDLEKKERSQYASAITKLEYDSRISTKFMVGTEAGRIILCTRKAKTDGERINVIYPGHSGPIYSIQRHPFFHKIFLSIGDWTLRIWSEEIRDDYIFCTKPNKCYLTDAQWCPGRPGVFVSSTTEGSIHIWDLLFKTDQPALTVKLSEEPISCLSFQEQGRYMALGTKNGNVTLMELSDSLCTLDRNEKQLVATMFDRETRRTHLLETRLRFKHDTQNRTITERSEEELNEERRQSTEQYWSIINKEKKKLQDYFKQFEQELN
ncbi:unnamed protein product [Rotaria magnacalcarata]|uniref:Dynein intermediate chain 2, axonemal n=5 Tax=Rotaria magnacalcarata TaxID=392030 RepID=A0A819NKY6_9BILA|nr:unnamed protein product [Rotaria magnacalcarata]CAF2107289.1 unnamed protein product [Rotaria magnacalcarata]CAF3998971.1 unnamed protein product [Rotaria magnacalcarata]CAF4090434.1 unnamed protein product [Rotaria magnacalcarata]